MPLSLFDEWSRKIPTLLGVAPNGPYGITDLWAAGGMPAVLKRMAGDLDLDCLTVTGKTLGDTIEAARVMDEAVIPPREKPLKPEGGIAVLTGNLAPDGSVIKAAGVKPEQVVYTGPAVCFSHEDEVADALRARRIPPGSVIVIRYAGPRGAPGMPEMLGVTAMIRTYRLDAAIITDGRYSGGTSGVCVGHISPEAIDGGPIAAVRDGDIITIDIPRRQINVQLTDEEIVTRMQTVEPVIFPTPRGFMERYRRHVSSAANGAVLQ